MKLFEDRVSSEHRDRVLQSVESELTRLQPRSNRRLLFGQAAAAFGTILVGLFIFKKINGTSKADIASAPEMENDPQMFANLDLIQDLDLWENLRLLEEASELDKDV